MNQDIKDKDQSGFYLNEVVLVGRAGSDAEIKYFDSGSAKATVSIAVDRFKSKSEKITDWFRIEFWDKSAEIAGEYIKKGTQICVDGRLGMNEWQDQKTGEKRVIYSIVANSFKLLGSKKDSSSENSDIEE